MRLGIDDSFVRVDTAITNLDAAPLLNTGLWVGTRDDYVGTTVRVPSQSTIFAPALAARRRAGLPSESARPGPGDSAELLCSPFALLSLLLLAVRRSSVPAPFSPPACPPAGFQHQGSRHLRQQHVRRRHGGWPAKQRPSDQCVPAVGQVRAVAPAARGSRGRRLLTTGRRVAPSATDSHPSPPGRRP